MNACDVPGAPMMHAAARSSDSQVRRIVPMRTRGASDARVDRVLTLPNVVTVVRLAAVPVFLWLLFGVQERVAAAALLAVLGATDWIDGWLARRLGQVSTLGKVLDPVADRSCSVVGVSAIMVDGAVPLWLGAAVLAREALVRPRSWAWPRSGRRGSTWSGWARPAPSG